MTMRMVTKITSPSMICRPDSGAAFMPMKNGFHLNPSMIG